MWMRIKTSLPLNLLLLLAAGAVAIGALRMARQAVGLWAELGDTRALVASLEQKKAQLERHLAELDTPEAIEREAKAKLNLKKSGENVIVVVPQEADRESPPLPAVWQKIRRFFAPLLPGRFGVQSEEIW